MGTNTILDIIGSIIIAGILMLSIFRLQSSSTEDLYRGTTNLNAQTNLATVIQILETDLRRIGYCADWQKIPIPTQAILYADSSSIRYLTDTDNNGTIDTMYYYFDFVKDIPQTPNPRDRFLYRIVNNESPADVNLGITQFKMEFYNALGTKLNFPISDPREIYSMQIDITVEDVSAYNENYQTIFWRQIRMAARNLFNR
ncbi:MAG: hypothetical protein DAHOPDDO_03022 [Ignavibacteriaceae bacterium]|jgi:hypothetical protein|nr:hypothetical protein [Ignavibacteriaceae bacterium]